MKRGIQDASQNGGREKHVRPQEGAINAESSAGSRTLVEQAPILALQSARTDNDMVVDEDHEISQGDSDSANEDMDDRDSGDMVLSTEDLFSALGSLSTRVRIRALKHILNSLSGFSNMERGRLLEIVRKKLYTEYDKGAKILLIQVLQSALDSTATADGRGIVEDLLNQLQADSTEVRVQVYNAISYIVKTDKLPRFNMSDINTIRALITTCVAELRDRHHRIRSAVLQLVSLLAPLLMISDYPVAPTSSQQLQGYSQHDIQVIISNYVTDPEPRVRKNAVKALLELSCKGFRLALVMYDIAVLALEDDYQEVRLEGLDLIYIYPDQAVQDPLATEREAKRLVDDAFIRICDMVNDSSMIVRAKACSYLGRFRSVDSKILAQTFSKQIMARLKVDMAPKNLAAGPAQKQAQRAKLIATPEGDQDVTAQPKLHDSGACGAFIHGLEDEYQDVRNAAINSICELCLHNPEFSILALDYMVDMFMDEIDFVRLNALTSLCKIGNQAPITFDTEQLQITLGVLEDADRDVREATHQMLEVVTMATADGMTSFLESLESNLNRFPEDQLSIYQCTRAVGRRHGAFIESRVAEMLNLNKMYLPIEGNVEDMLYCAKLVLIFNAATQNPRILQHLPKYTFKHYTYLRDKYPNCFPEPSEIPCLGTQHLRDLASALTMTIAKDTSDDMQIQALDANHSPAANVATSAYAATIATMRVQTEEDAESFYGRALVTLDRIPLLTRQLQVRHRSGRARRREAASLRAMLLQQIAACQRDLRYVANVHAKQGRSAEFATMYLECCDILVRIQDSYGAPSFAMTAPLLSAQLFRLSYYMDHVFLGLDATARVSVGYFRVLANLVWFFGMVQVKSTTSSAASLTSFTAQTESGATREYLKSMLHQAVKRIIELLRHMDQPEVEPEWRKKHRIVLDDLRVAITRASESPTTQQIINLMSEITFVPMGIDFRTLALQRISALVTRPLPNRDIPLDIHPSFPFLVPVEGMIHHVGDTSGIAVQVTFPQNIVRQYYPPPDHFTCVDDDGASSGGVQSKQRRDANVEDDETPASRTRTYRLRTQIEVYPEASWGSLPTELRITLSRSFRPDLVGHDEFICRFAEEVAFDQRRHQSLSLTENVQQQAQSQQHLLSLVGPRGLPAANGFISEDAAVSGTTSSSASSSSGSSSTLNVNQSQSTLEISEGITYYYVKRRAMFTQ
ncbi:Integrator complex subunit 4 [Mortierella polycephala]|uniref:Integrator complex subunit 4 n=1 Tax=Mortierella polycephala TaxID=41804 RepID=A0A9P6PQP5_9FUNG|nr:Integrator complex subunit 4 [Mortierella polycephala]